MYTYKNRVSFSQIDKDGKMSVADVVDALQDSFMFHIGSAGKSALDLLKEDRAWMVNTWHAKINDRPLFEEYYTVDSWVSSMKGTLSTWNFQMNSYVKAESIWFFAIPSTGKPARITPEIKETFSLGEPIFEVSGKRQVSLPEGMLSAGTIPVRECYLDSNHHVNNGEYIRLALSFLPEDFSVKELFAEYRNAARIGDTFFVKTCFVTDTNNEFYVSFEDETGTPYFLCQFIA